MASAPELTATRKAQTEPLDAAGHDSDTMKTSPLAEAGRPETERLYALGDITELLNQPAPGLTFSMAISYYEMKHWLIV